MHRAALGKIREAYRQTQFPCLQSFASQLADHPRAFAQGKYQRRRVVRLVVRQRGVAGDRGTILYLQQQRLVPAAIGKQPQLLPPNAEPLLHYRGRQPRHITEGQGAQCRQRTFAALAHPASSLT